MRLSVQDGALWSEGDSTMTTTAPKEVQVSRLSMLRLETPTLTAALLLAMLLAPSSEASGQARHRSLVGTWELQVAAYDCETGAPLGPPFSSIQTYLESGSVVEEANVVGPPPVFMRTSGLGVWRREGAREFRAFLKIFRFDSGGAPLDRADVEITIELAQDRDELVGAGSITSFTPNGTELATVCSASSGTRMTLPE